MVDGRDGSKPLPLTLGSAAAGGFGGGVRLA
jgi:hypothetical protein